MALTTYSELQAHIVSNLFGRADLTSEIKDFIRLAETHMSARLKHRKMDNTTTLTITDGVATVPTEFQSVHSIRLLSAPYPFVSYEPIEVIETRRPDITGTIEVYDIVGDEFIFWPPSSDTARLRYRQEIAALSDSNTSNWVLAKFPTLYVYGALMEAYLHLKDSKNADKYASLFTGTMDEANMANILNTIANAQVSPNGAVA